jgi:hypothetical protein
VTVKLYQIPIIQTGSFQMPICDLEAKWSHQVEGNPNRRTEPGYIASIGGDPGLYQHYLGHHSDFIAQHSDRNRLSSDGPSNEPDQVKSHPNGCEDEPEKSLASSEVEL